MWWRRRGDIDIAAKSVEIEAAEQASRTVTEDKHKQSGVTLSVTSPVISAMQSVDQLCDVASKTKSGRAKALPAAPIVGIGGGINHSYGGQAAVEAGVGFPRGATADPAGYGFDLDVGQPKEVKK
jgi:hypothetical protein